MMTNRHKAGADEPPHPVPPLVTAAVLIAGGFNVVVGLWIFVSPHSFYDVLAVFRPYNRHFLHDAAAFEIGLGVMVLLALRWSDALVVTLTGFSTGSWLHVLSHAIDRHIGGHPGRDIPGLAALAALTTAAAVVRARQVLGDPKAAPALRR
jgi:hypothetical protein